MDNPNRELRYIEKIENDVIERMYDLLIQHLMDIDSKVSTNSVHKDKLIEVLDQAIRDLRQKVNYYNQKRFNRYILIICNRILRYDTLRSDLKELKISIIDDFTHSEHELKEKIPLDYQINELRITYDTSYAFYLIREFIRNQDWVNALYFVMACQLLEPDDESIDSFYETIKDNLKPKIVSQEFVKEKNNLTLVLDANIIIKELRDLISQTVYSNIRINHKTKRINLTSLESNNQLIITNSVKTEIEEFIEAELSNLKKRLSGREFSEIKRRLKGLFNEFINKYHLDTGVIDASILERVKNFYSQYPVKLESIMNNKLKFGTVSKKLRKLAQRKFLLPEKGDLNLIAEVIKLNQDKEHVILSNDQDFTEFSGNLASELGIKVYSND